MIFEEELLNRLVLCRLPVEPIQYQGIGLVTYRQQRHSSETRELYEYMYNKASINFFRRES